jgi:putative endonuclease
MTAARLALGRKGEALAAARLRGLGWRILATNTRVQGIRGELDIVAHDGTDIVFVEVKTGRVGTRSGPVSPLELVGPAKHRQLRKLAGGWTAAHRGELPAGAGIRIDVIAVRLDGSGRIHDWEHVRGV